LIDLNELLKVEKTEEKEKERKNTERGEESMARISEKTTIKKLSDQDEEEDLIFQIAEIDEVDKKKY